MKKRILCWLCAAALCLGLLAAPVTMGAPDDPCFVAVNDNLLPLEDRYIPILVSGAYYIPYQVLDKYSTGLELGVFPIHNTMTKTLTIYSRDQVLTFDLVAGTCEGRNGNSLPARAVIRNGQIYVPAQYICSFFGLTYLYRYTASGRLIRICNAYAFLDDDNFVGAAELMMGERLREWRNAQNAAANPSPTPAPTPTPVTTVQPSVTPNQPQVDKSGVGVYMAFRVEDTQGLDSLLARLEYHGIHALFFFPADGLAGYDETIRRVLCGGHTVGLTVTGATAEEIVQQAALGNQTLKTIAHAHTYTVLGTDEASRAAARESGLLCWETDVDACPDDREPSAQAKAVEKAVDRYEERVFLLADTSTEGIALTKLVLTELTGQEYSFRLATETQLWKESE